MVAQQSYDDKRAYIKPKKADKSKALIGKFVKCHQLYVLDCVVNSPKSDEELKLSSSEFSHQGGVGGEGNDEDPTHTHDESGTDDKTQENDGDGSCKGGDLPKSKNTYCKKTEVQAVGQSPVIEMAKVRAEVQLPVKYNASVEPKVQYIEYVCFNK